MNYCYSTCVHICSIHITNLTVNYGGSYVHLVQRNATNLVMQSMMSLIMVSILWPYLVTKLASSGG